MSLPHKYSTIGYSVPIIATIWTTTLSNLTTTNKDDTDVKNDDNSESFANPRENNHSATELSDTNTTTDWVKLEFNPCQHQNSTLNQTTPLKLSPSGRDLKILIDKS